jgi:hypothetical protein
MRFAYRTWIGSGAGRPPSPSAPPSRDSAPCSSAYVHGDFPPETVAWLHYIRTAQALGFSLTEISRNCAELRAAPDTATALSALFQEKISLIDARMAELAALRADLAARVDTGCPLRPAGGAPDATSRV